MPRHLALAVAAAALIPAAAAAHPHVFVDATVEIVFDEAGRIGALRIGWSYDELFSLMMVEDKGADADADGTVSAEELQVLKGFDAEWPPDYEGDTYVTVNGQAVPLDPTPADWEEGWTGGHLWSRHTRRLAEPLDPSDGPVVIRIYDPGYYVAYAIAEEVTITGRADCTAQVFVPDLDAAQEELQAALKEYLPGETIDETAYPDVGGSFAEEVRLTCGD